MPDLELSLQDPSGNRPSPVAGYFAIVFGLLGIFSIGYVFVPLAFIASLVALFSGQIIWGIFGLMLGLAGLLTSPFLLAFLGLAWMAAVFGFA